MDARRVLHGESGGNVVRRTTIARYSAAISDGLREGTGCCRGGIARRWTKPAVASPVCDVLSEASSLSRTRLGELYPASREGGFAESGPVSVFHDEPCGNIGPWPDHCGSRRKEGQALRGSFVAEDAFHGFIAVAPLKIHSGPL
jgi:hypothetical protein